MHPAADRDKKVTQDIIKRHQVDEVLQHSQELFRSLSACSPVGIFFTDIQGRYTYTNSRYQAICGITLKESLGEGWMQSVHPEDREWVCTKWTTSSREGQEYSEEYRLLIHSSQQADSLKEILRWVHVRTSPLHSAEAEVIGHVGTVEDITERKQAQQEQPEESALLIREQTARIEAEAAQQRSTFLAEASRVLASSLDYETTLKSMAQLAVPTLSDWCVVDILKEDGSLQRLATAHIDPAKVEWAWELQRRYPTDLNAPQGVAQVLRTGQSEYYPLVLDSQLVTSARDAEHLKILREVGLNSVMIVPLLARGRTLGTISFISAESGRHYSAADLSLAENLAHRAALALDNARLYQEAQLSKKVAEQAAERTARLQAVTTALSESLTPSQVAEVIVEQAMTVLGGSSALVALVTESGTELEIIRAVGFEQDLVESWRRFPVTAPFPLSEAVRSGEPVWSETTTSRAARYPHLAQIYSRYNFSAWMSVPLIVQGRAVGGLSLAFNRIQQLSQDDRAFILTLTRQCAQAIDRARLYEAEQKARNAAETANHLKDEFLAIVSHELRTPLNSILGWSQMLRHRKFDLPTVERALEIIERNAKSQNQLLEDLLDISRIMRGKVSINVRPINLVSVIEAALEAVRLTAETKNVRLETQFDHSASAVLGDSERLQQVVWNLLTNAVKFTPAGGHIEVRLQRRGLNAQIQVIDTGVGIRSDFLPYVFETFRQADGTSTRSHGGLGLGLAIVRQLVELHDGTVQAESQGEGLGSTFTVKLPLLERKGGEREGTKEGEEELSPTSSDPPVYPSPQILKDLRVLVVDDELDNREFVTFMLRQNGAEVTAVASTQEALQVLQQFQPDVLVSDIGMPKEDGYTLIRKVRALDPAQGGNVPAIALTAYVREADRQQAIAAGFQRHLSKPVEASELVKSVATLAGCHKM